MRFSRRRIDYGRAIIVVANLIAIIGAIGANWGKFSPQLFSYINISLILMGIGLISLAVTTIFLLPYIIDTLGNRWHFVDGQLVIGNTNNVALRIKTIQRILNSL